MKKIKSQDAPSEAKKTKEVNAKPNHETNDSSSNKPENSQPNEKIKEKRKPGRPGKKKINN